MATRRQATEQEKALFEKHEASRREATPEEKAAFESNPGEPGHAGASPYSEERQQLDAERNAEPVTPEGTLGDAAMTWANKAALGAGPQIEGVMAAGMHAAVDPMHPQGDIDAYRDVRDEGKRQHKAAEHTMAGKAAIPLGIISTPIPTKSTAGMTAGERAWQGAKVGGGTGVIAGAAQSQGDLTKFDSGNAKQVLVDALLGGSGGFIGGAALGAASKAPALAGDEARLGAGKLALGSLGMTPAQRGQLAASGKGTAAAQELVGKNSTPGLLGFTKAGTAEHVAHGLEGAGGELGDIKNAIDARKGNSTVLPDVLAGDIETAARAHGRAATPEEAGTPEAAAVMRDMLARAERARNFGSGKPISLSDAEAVFKSPLNDVARKVKSSTSEPPSAALARALTRDAAAGSNERAAEAGLSVLEPDLAGKYGPAKERYGTLKELARILEKSQPEAFAKRGLEPVSLPTLDLDVGANSQGFSGGIRGFIGRQLRNVAAPLAAKGLNATGKALQSTPTGGTTAGGLAPYLELLEEQKKKDGGQ